MPRDTDGTTIEGPPRGPSLLGGPDAQRINAAQALAELRAIVASDGYAMTALTLAHYRQDLLQTIDNYIGHTSHERPRTTPARKQR